MAVVATLRDQQRLRDWAAPRMGVERLADDMVVMGILNGDVVVAAVGFNAFYDGAASLHVASDGGRRWLTKRTLRAIFGYAFGYRGLRRLNLIVAASNKAPQILALKCGGVPEGYLRRAAPDGSDAVIYGILHDECPWAPARTKESDNG